MVVNNSTAINMPVAAIRLGLKIPDDLAVVGFDNLKIFIRNQKYKEMCL